MPQYVVLLCDRDLTEQSGVTLSPEGKEAGMTVLYAYRPLPGACRAVIDGKGCAPESVTHKQAEDFARSLAPVRLRASSGAAKLPEIIPLLQGLGAGKPEELNILGRWAQSRPFESLAVPIGMRENGEVFRFDVHERGYGPHGIVAGTAGWGKSELLTNWLLSLALHYKPDEVNFVLIDFKGEGFSGMLLRLPHVAGAISNIQDLSSIERNLAALQGELLRRERVFAQNGIDGIHKYQIARRAGRVTEPLPYLIVVIDEFAELKTEHPDQMDKFIQIARKGRSSGIHLVLATQSIGGGIVTGQVSANARFRICLRTAEAGESKDILGTPDAYDLTVRGRAIIKVGNNEVYERVQTFFSKAPYRPDRAPGMEIEVVGLAGNRVRPMRVEATAAAQEAPMEREAVAQYIQDICARGGIMSVRKVWPEPLPETLYLRELLDDCDVPPGGFAVPVGLVDDPENQRQYPFMLDFARQNHLFYGAPSVGKTSLLRTALVAAAKLYTPEFIQFAILDYGTWGLKIMERLPHCRCYASEQDGVAEAEGFLKSEIDRRRRVFARQGVGRLEDYREITGEVMPWLLVAIDNLAALHNDHPDFLDTLMIAARDGAALGIGLLMTTGGGGAFLYRMQNYIQNVHCLRLTDKGEYRQHVGGDGRHEPGNFPGRGFTRGSLEFQTALFMDGATEAERVKNLRALCEASQSVASTQERPPLSRCTEYIQLGYDEKSEPVPFHFAEMSGCVFVNNDLLEEVIQALLGRVVRDDYDTQIEEIASEYDRRSEDGISEPPIYVCVNDYLTFFEAVDNETVARLDLLVRYGENCGIFVYIAGKAEMLNRFAQLKEPLFRSCLLSGNAVVAGQCGFIETQLLGRNEVCLLHNGAKTRMEVPHA